MFVQPAGFLFFSGLAFGQIGESKIAGSAQLALYRETGEKLVQKAAIEELELAADAWKEYTENALQQNKNPIWTNRVGFVDWIKITKWVEDDIKIARKG